MPSRGKKTDLGLDNAIAKRDAEKVGAVVDHLRFRKGLDYGQCYALARELTGVSQQEWDELLSEADELASNR